jgi:hypothetical protein
MAVLSCDNHGMGRRGYLAVVLAAIAAAVAFLAGWSVRDAVGSGHGDWGATVATLASWSGDAGKIALGALIGAVGAWIVAWQNRSDAKTARDEARAEARRVAFLDQRQACINDFLIAATRCRSDMETLPVAVQYRKPLPEIDLHPAIEAFATLDLMAPDVAGTAGNHVMSALRNCLDRTAELGNAVYAQRGHGGQVDPRISKAADAAIAEVQDSLAAFRKEAGRHLGVLTTGSDQREG